jgi:hypothetical protein
MNDRAFLTICALITLGIAACASSEPEDRIYLRTELLGDNEVPPVDSPAVGAATGIMNRETGVLTWNVSYSGLSGPATAAHFHGPANESSNAGVQINLGSDLASPTQGATRLTKGQQQQLLDGKWYGRFRRRDSAVMPRRQRVHARRGGWPIYQPMNGDDSARKNGSANISAMATTTVSVVM